MNARNGSSGLLILLGFLTVWGWMVSLPALGFFGLVTVGSGTALASTAILDNQGAYVWPVQGRITSAFGLRWSPDGPGSEYHTGLDIAANTGTPVKAAAAGRVRLAQAVGTYGNLVILEHPGPYGVFETWYGHLSEFAVKAGAMVEQGQIVGRVGSTGRSTGPHLHFEYRTRSAGPQDPYRLYR